MKMYEGDSSFGIYLSRAVIASFHMSPKVFKAPKSIILKVMCVSFV